MRIEPEHISDTLRAMLLKTGNAELVAAGLDVNDEDLADSQKLCHDFDTALYHAMFANKKPAEQLLSDHPATINTWAAVANQTTAIHSHARASREQTQTLAAELRRDIGELGARVEGSIISSSRSTELALEYAGRVVRASLEETARDTVRDLAIGLDSIQRAIRGLEDCLQAEAERAAAGARKYRWRLLAPQITLAGCAVIYTLLEIVHALR